MNKKKQNQITEENITGQMQIPAPEKQDQNYKQISLDLIDDPEQAMRINMTPESVEDLIVSMRQVGLIEPVIVKPKEGRYEIIAGHRRTYAARLAKIPTIPCIIKDVDNDKTEMMKIHENLYRKDVKPAEEALHYEALIKRHKMTPTKIANMISRSLSYVTERLDILTYPDFLREALDKGEISFAVAREFARFDDLKQMSSAVYFAKRGGMTSEVARKWVQDHKRAKEGSPFQPTQQTNVVNGQEQVSHMVNCVYCTEQLKLFEAQVVYIHQECLQSVNEQPDPQQTPQDH